MAIDPLKIIVEIQNKQEIDQLTAASAKAEEEVIRLNTALKAGTLNTAQFAAQAKPFADTIATNAARMKDLQAASAGAGRGLSQLSYAVDDIQYGFNAIVNNIPQIVMGLGGSAGIAGAVGIAAVAINQLIKHWGELTDAFQANWSGSTAEGLKIIRERAEEAAKAFDKLLASQTAAQGKEATEVGKAITEGPTQRIQAALLVALQGDPLQHKARAEEAMGFQSLGPGAVPRQTKSQAELDADARKKDLETIKTLMGEATIAGPTGEYARNQLKRLAGKNPDAFPQGFASDLDAASPEGQKRQSDFEKQVAARKQVEANIAKARDEHTHKAEGQAKREGEIAKDIDKRRTQERITALQDQEKLIQKQKHAMSEAEWERTHNQPRNAQILAGAKSAIDLYQTSGSNQQKELAIKAHKLQEEANKKLEKIREAVTKEQRLLLRI